ncbi:MAG: peptidylprolyl isomerase [Bacteroidetes bacterium]|nr:peptidylprolyl isomerase [Bacteroidota bacterium]
MKPILSALLILLSLGTLQAQKERYVDGILAVVGEKIITYSDYLTEYDQVSKQTGPGRDGECFVFEQLLIRKLLMNQAELDSLPVDENRVDAEIENKLRYYARQLGSERKLEEFLGKSLSEYKRDIRPRVKEQMLSRDMENKVLENVKISPREVQEYYESIPRDSLPLIGAEVEVAELIVVPKVSAEAKAYAKEKAEDLRNRILRGASFDKLASAYSEDPGSALQGGLLPEFGRGDMVPEFERAAFRLKADSISKVIESPYGYHVIKLISRRGERIICRHILIRPQITSEDLLQAKRRVDSAYSLLMTDSITWCNAVKRFGDQESGRKGECGFYSDENTGVQKVAVDALEKDLVKMIQGMPPGTYGEPQLTVFPDGARAYRLVYLKSETKPHTANTIQDYPKIQQAALQQKKDDALNAWVRKTRLKTYISISKDFENCPSVAEWTRNNSNQ